MSEFKRGISTIPADSDLRIKARSSRLTGTGVGRTTRPIGREDRRRGSHSSATL
jgi:hypothetical protein